MSEEPREAIYQKEYNALIKVLCQIPELRSLNRYEEFAGNLSNVELDALLKAESTVALCETLRGDMEFARQAPGKVLESARAAVLEAIVRLESLAKNLRADTTAGVGQAKQVLISQMSNFSADYTSVFETVGQLVNWGKIIAEREIVGLLGSRRQKFDEIVSLHDSATATVDQIESLNKRSNEFLRGKGIAAHAGMMKREARGHVWRAIVWGTATFGFCALFFWSVWRFRTELVPALSTDGGPLEMSTGVAIQMAVIKLMLGSVAMFIIYFCARACQSHMHNATVNRHRYNALRTFELFQERGDVEGPTYDALLLYVAQAIFAPQRTGFIGKDPAVSAMTPALRIAQGLSKAETAG